MHSSILSLSDNNLRLIPESSKACCQQYKRIKKPYCRNYPSCFYNGTQPACLDREGFPYFASMRYSHNFYFFLMYFPSLISRNHVFKYTLTCSTTWKPQFVGRRRKARLGTRYKGCLRHWSSFEMERHCMKKLATMAEPYQYQWGAHLQCSGGRRWQNCNFPLF